MTILLRAKPELSRDELAAENREHIEKHGYLWIQIDRDPEDGMRECRSLATGQIYWWYDDEVEHINIEEEPNHG